jgi:hypothetical protein
MGGFTVNPLIATPVPRTAVIVAIPVGADFERYDRHTEAWRIRIERHIAAVIVVRDIRCVEPAAIVRETDITPTPIIETAVDLNGRARVQLCDYWIGIVGTRIDTCRIGRYGILGCRRS